MLTIESLMDAISESSRNTRKDYHLTLGGLITILESAEGCVRFADGSTPGDEMSYRGYYSDLAFEPQSESKTVSEFLGQCKAAHGNTYEGYKGGDNVMADDTPLWKALYGSCGDAIVDAIKTESGIVLVTKHIDF
jgi:hypothetical protein